MKKLVFFLIIFNFISCSKSENKQKLIAKEVSNQGKKGSSDSVSAIQELIIGRWLEMDGDSNSIMTISKDSIIGGFTQGCWSKYKIEPEKDHIIKPKMGQYWFGFAFQPCKENNIESFSGYFGNILVDSSYLKCHDGIDDGETVVFKRIR